MPDTSVISVKEACEKTGYSGSHIRDLLSRGVISGEKFAGVWMVDADSIERYRSAMQQMGRKKHGTWALAQSN